MKTVKEEEGRMCWSGDIIMLLTTCWIGGFGLFVCLFSVLMVRDFALSLRILDSYILCLILN